MSEIEAGTESNGPNGRQTDHFVPVGDATFVLPSHAISKGRRGDYLQRQIECDMSHIRYYDHIFISLFLPHLEQTQDNPRRFLEDQRVVSFTEGRRCDLAVLAPLVVLRGYDVPTEKCKSVVRFRWFGEVGTIQ